MKQQCFTLSSAPAHQFFITLKSHKALENTHSRAMASFVMQENCTEEVWEDRRFAPLW